MRSIERELKIDSLVYAWRRENRQAERGTAADRREAWIIVAGGVLVTYNGEFK